MSDSCTWTFVMCSDYLSQRSDIFGWFSLSDTVRVHSVIWNASASIWQMMIHVPALSLPLFFNIGRLGFGLKILIQKMTYYKLTDRYQLSEQNSCATFDWFSWCTAFDWFSWWRSSNVCSLCIKYFGQELKRLNHSSKYAAINIESIYVDACPHYYYSCCLVYPPSC